MDICIVPFNGIARTLIRTEQTLFSARYSICFSGQGGVGTPGILKRISDESSIPHV